MRPSPAQRGNILFLILLAIVLFVALNYAVMGQREQIAEGIPKEKADTMAAQIIQNMSLIENSMMRAMTVDGVRDYEFDISGTGSNSAANTTCLSGSCKIFASQGGAAPDLIIPLWASTASAGNEQKARWRAHKIQNVGTDSEDLVVFYQQLRKEVCESINRLSGNKDVDLTLNIGWGAGITFSGPYTSFPTGSGILANGVTSLYGRRSFCFWHGGGGGYTFFYTLIAR